MKIKLTVGTITAEIEDFDDIDGIEVAVQLVLLAIMAGGYDPGQVRQIPL